MAYFAADKSMGYLVLNGIHYFVIGTQSDMVNRNTDSFIPIMAGAYTVFAPAEFEAPALIE